MSPRRFSPGRPWPWRRTFSAGGPPPRRPCFGRGRRISRPGPVLRPFGVEGADEAVPAIADEILPPGLVQRLRHQAAQFRPLPLEEGPLQGLLVGVPGHVDLLHGPGVDAGVPHAGGEGPRRGIEVLDLLGLAAGPVQKLRQLHRVGEGAPRVAAHEVGDDVLLQAVALVEALVLLLKAQIHVEVGLAHVVQHPAGAVLRGHLQLAGDVVAHQIGEEFAVFLAEHVVKADTAADEHLLHPRMARTFRSSWR